MDEKKVRIINPLIKYTNEIFKKLYRDKNRYLVLMGGGGSGKSIFAGQKVLYRCVTEPGHRVLVIRKTARSLKESCFRQLLGQIEEYYSDVPHSCNKTDYSIKLGESEIIMRGIDDEEKIKSIYKIDMIWIEEATELTEEDFNQLDIRLRGKTDYYKQIILSFNPVSVMSWLKKRFFDTVSKNATVCRSTYLDNKFIDREQAAVLEAYKNTDEYYYRVYCLGEWGSTGASVFDSKTLYKRLEELPPPMKKGRFAYGELNGELNIGDFEDDEKGEIEIYQLPKKGRPYVIGGDTAGDGSDCFTAQVIDNITSVQVALLRHRHDSDFFVSQIFALGKYYNDALISVETNFDLYPVRMLERYRYPNMYVREALDDYTHRPLNSYGFRTDAQSRPLIISNLISAVRGRGYLINSRITLEEMLSFIKNKNGRPEAAAGTHDDTVMSLAIAHFCRNGQSYTETDSTVPHGLYENWSRDMIEDYENAPPDIKEYLFKKWSQI